MANPYPEYEPLPHIKVRHKDFGFEGVALGQRHSVLRGGYTDTMLWVRWYDDSEGEIDEDYIEYLAD
jgi:hypothetical protein